MLNNQHSTAINAYHNHLLSGKAKSQCEMIIEFIKNSNRDWSIGELAYKLKMEKSTVSARIYECLKKEKLITKEKRIDRRSGIKIRPVGVAGQID